MKFFTRSIQLLLIFVLISFIGITPASSAKEIVFPEPYECYRPYDTITNRMAELTTLYPDLASVEIIGHTLDGHPIEVLQLGREVETNTRPRLVLVSGLQANALAPVELNLRFAEILLEGYGEDANITWLLEQAEIHIIVVANPDGRLLAELQTHNGEDPTWTKNRHAYECITGDGGVALGQNFSFEWASVITDACAPNYPSPSAASELETKAIETYLEQILEQNHERSLVIDLQNEGDWLITPFLYSKTAENPYEDELFMLANKLIHYNDRQTTPLRGSSDDIRILTGNLTDFSFGQVEAPALRFNLGPELAGGDVTHCWYYETVLEPEGLDILTRAAILAVDPLAQAQGPEIVFTDNEQGLYTATIVGQANDMIFYKLWPNQDEYSAVHHVSFSLDTPPWLPDAVMTLVDWSQPTSNAPWEMDFSHTFHFEELTPGNHTIYFQAWDTDPLGDPGQAGMINAVEINVQILTFFPLLMR